MEDWLLENGHDVQFAGFEVSDSFISYLNERRARVREIFEKYLIK